MSFYVSFCGAVAWIAIEGRKTYKQSNGPELTISVRSFTSSINNQPQLRGAGLD